MNTYQKQNLCENVNDKINNEKQKDNQSKIEMNE